MTSPDDLTDHIEPGVVVGEYRVEGPLGKGGMATVYAAVHPVIGKRAAIKVVNRHLLSEPEAIERFIQEAQTVNRIGHPNIVDIFSIGTLADGRPYFVMEWLQGETLGARIEREALDVDEAVDVLTQLCLALEVVHEVGVVHRDLKPENIYLVPVRGRATPLVKLLDFGVAKLQQREGMNRVTRTGMAVGTPAYVSPEQARGVAIDARSDIYALGVITYEILTGRLPFAAESALDTMMMHVQAPPPSLRAARPDLPEILDDLVAAMLAKTPEARPTLGEIREALASISGESPAASLRTSAALAQTMSIERVRSRRRVATVLGLAAALALTLVAIIVVYPPSNDEPARTPVAQPMLVVDAAVAAAPAAPDVKPATVLVLRVSTSGARIEIDGEPIANVRDGMELEVDRPGEHAITATAPGHQPWRKTVIVAEGQRTDVEISLERIARRKAPKPKPPPRGDNYTLDPFKKGNR